MTVYTYTKTGTVLTADNGCLFWHRLNASEVHETATGRDIYLPTGGYASNEGFGTDPAPADIVKAARDFVDEVRAEEVRREAEKQAADSQRFMEFQAVLSAIPPAAQAELDSVNAEWRRRAATANEMGDGYVHQVGWSCLTGKEVLAKHGLSESQISAIGDAERRMAGS